jgi:hypothetical protein
MKRSGTLSALLVGASVIAGAPHAVARQDGVPTLSTDDVRRDPNSVTGAREAKAAAAEAAVAEEDAAPVRRGVSAGYTLVTTSSGYRFERPSDWKAIENLTPENAPSYFKYDALFQDPATGAVVSAISIDRSQLASPIDIADASSLNTLLATMLNPVGATSGVKIFRQTTGDGPRGSKWLRIKAQGTGQAEDGAVVDTIFWVQIVQTETRFALVAVGYPATQQNAVAEAAFHTVRTLEIHDGAGTQAGAEERERS